MAKTIYIKNVHKITLFCNLHSISKKTACYNSGTKCICYTYQIPSKCIISANIEPLKFRTYLLNLSFSRPLMKIISTESYVFFLARTYRARIQLIFLLKFTCIFIMNMFCRSCLYVNRMLTSYGRHTNMHILSVFLSVKDLLTFKSDCQLRMRAAAHIYTRMHIIMATSVCRLDKLVCRHVLW